MKPLIMKSIIRTIAPVCVGCSVLASSALADQPIPSSQLSQYAEAAEMAVQAMSFQSCTDKGGTYSAEVDYQLLEEEQRYALADLSVVASGTVANPGEQPALTLIANAKDPQTGVVYAQDIVKIISSSDGKSAVEITVTKQEYEKVNAGTLTDPSITQQWVTTDQYDCK